MPWCNDEEEISISRQYAEFCSVATKSEQSILIALARVRNSIIRNSDVAKPPDQLERQARNLEAISLLFPQYAHILRQTAAWKKISQPERDRIERELLTLLGP